MMQLTSGDAKIYYLVEGQGPPLVLLHPFPANHKFWRLAAPALTARYQLIMPDFRGHGASESGQGPATMEKHAADLLRVCEAAGVQRATFMGVSIGGYMLFEFWRRYRERVQALILCDTRAQADTPEGRATRLKSADDVLKRGPDAFLDEMVQKLLGATTKAQRPDLVASARQMMGEMTPAGIAAVQRGMAERPDSTLTLKTITVPTLIMVGEEDTLTPVADAELMRQHIKNSRLETVPRAGHYAPFEQHEFSVKVVRRFLEESNKQ
ncbi:MAG: alpha/beta hydrolase [Acidobacteriales bacterium]|nr:alpha/beta hydrolase [Terriglobales bacterium]